jgi:hypothetical protein
VSETKLTDEDKMEIDGYTIYMKNRQKARRSSGGVAIIVKNELCKHIKIIDTNSEFTLWFKISKNVTGYELLCCNIYIPPENSNYSNINMFDTLEEEFVSLHNDEIACFFGDFNARTKDLNDLVSLDSKVLDSLDVVDEYIKDKIDEENILEDMGFQLNRVSQDLKSNNYGLRLLDLCRNLGLCLFNGRIGCDKGVGSTTCDNISVVDYIMGAPRLFPLISEFKIQEFDCNFSDKHCPLYLAIKVVDPSFFQNREKCQDHITGDRNAGTCTNVKPKWSNDKSDEFKNVLSSDKVTHLYEIIQNINTEGMTQEDMDEVVNSIGNIFADCAAEVGIVGKNKPQGSKRQTDRKPWYNAECEEKRRMYFNGKNQYAASKTLILRNGMRNLNREYKKTLRKAYNAYYIEMNKKLRGLRCTNPKEYWSILNKGNKKPDNIPIDNDTFYNHFKNLNNTNVDKEAECIIKEQGSVEFNVELNSPFTAQEISKCIDKLKTNKAYGTDMILNEYIKYSGDKMLLIYERLFNLVLKTGLVPSTWLTGVIKPLYKKKGAKDDVNNYRGITILSCFGKLFTSVLNERLPLF